MIPSTIAIIALATVLAVFVGAWLFRRDTAKEERRRNAIQASALLTSMGLKRLPKMLTAYAVGDYSGLAHEMKEFAQLALDEKALAAEFDGTFKNVLSQKIKTPEGRALITVMLHEGA